LRPRTDELIRRIREGIEAAGEPTAGAQPRPPLRAREALAALSRRLPLDPRDDIRSHRKLLGPAIVAAKKVFRRLVLTVLEPYFRRETEFLRELVRYETEIAARLEELAEREAKRERTPPDGERRT
jgi:hypothetical protein